MDDKIIEDLKNWQKGTQDMFNNLTNFVDTVKKDLTPEQKAVVEEKMKDVDSGGLKEEMDKITKKLNEEMAKFNFDGR